MPYPLFRDCTPVPAFLAYMPPGAAALRDLAPGTCHWPRGEVEDDSFGFCGAAAGHHVYCTAHRRLAARRRR